MVSLTRPGSSPAGLRCGWSLDISKWECLGGEGVKFGVVRVEHELDWGESNDRYILFELNTNEVKRGFFVMMVLRVLKRKRGQKAGALGGRHDLSDVRHITTRASDACVSRPNSWGRGSESV